MSREQDLQNTTRQSPAMETASAATFGHALRTLWQLATDTKKHVFSSATRMKTWQAKKSNTSNGYGNYARELKTNHLLRTEITGGECPPLWLTRMWLVKRAKPCQHQNTRTARCQNQQRVTRESVMKFLVRRPALTRQNDETTPARANKASRKHQGQIDEPLR